jgi:hypothetical protein
MRDPRAEMHNLSDGVSMSQPEQSQRAEELARAAQAARESRGGQRVPAGHEPRRGGPSSGTWAFGCLGVIFLIGAIYTLLGGSTRDGTPGPDSTGHSADTGRCGVSCVVVDKLEVQAAVVDRDAHLPTTLPGPGEHIFVVHVSIRNGNDVNESLNPFDFELRDPNGQEHRITFSIDDTCAIMEAVDLAPGGNISANLCYEASGSPSAPHTLVWTHGFADRELLLP